MAQAQTVSGTIVGYFENQAGAQKAVEALRDAGFSSAHIGVASRAGEPLPTSDTSTGVGSGTVSGTASNAAHAVGEKTEGVWDKVKSFFDGGGAEPYADEKQDGDLATREITADPTYAGAEDFHGTLKGMSVPEDRSKYFSHRFGSGDEGALVTVSAPGRESEAVSILTSNGGDVGDASESYDYAAQPATTGRTDGAQNIQLLGEVLRVHKDRVSRGEVTLRKEVVTEMQTIQVPVTREELVIERHAVAGGTAATGNIGDAGEIRIPLTEETASVDKSTFVREEVSVGKRQVEDVRELSSEVRSEELVVDDQTKTVGSVNKTPTR